MSVFSPSLEIRMECIRKISQHIVRSIIIVLVFDGFCLLVDVVYLLLLLNSSQTNSSWKGMRFGIGVQ